MRKQAIHQRWFQLSHMSELTEYLQSVPSFELTKKIAAQISEESFPTKSDQDCDRDFRQPGKIIHARRLQRTPAGPRNTLLQLSIHERPNTIRQLRIIEWTRDFCQNSITTAKNPGPKNEVLAPQNPKPSHSHHSSRSGLFG